MKRWNNKNVVCSLLLKHYRKVKKNKMERRIVKYNCVCIISEIPMGYLCVRFVFGYNGIIDMFALLFLWFFELAVILFKSREKRALAGNAYQIIIKIILLYRQPICIYIYFFFEWSWWNRTKNTRLLFSFFFRFCKIKYPIHHRVSSYPQFKCPRETVLF